MPTQAGRFDTEEDVLRYMLDPFPWLLMAVYELDQEHKIAGSVVEASAKTAESGAATTDGESTSREDTGKKSAPKKGAKAKAKGQKSGPKKQDQSAQHLKTIAMLKESLTKAQAENARLRGDAHPPTKQATKKKPPSASDNGEVSHEKNPTSPAQQRPASPQPAATPAPVDEGPILPFVVTTLSFKWRIPRKT